MKIFRELSTPFNTSSPLPGDMVSGQLCQLRKDEIVCMISWILRLIFKICYNGKNLQNKPWYLWCWEAFSPAPNFKEITMCYS